MRIVKHGNLKPRLFICPECGCEFIAEVDEYNVVRCHSDTIWYDATCPECCCRTNKSEPWEEPNE